MTQGDMIETYKILQGIYDKEASQNIIPRKHKEENMTTRGHSLKIPTQYSRLKLRKNSFSQRITSLWNELPESVSTVTKYQVL